MNSPRLCAGCAAPAHYGSWCEDCSRTHYDKKLGREVTERDIPLL